MKPAFSIRSKTVVLIIVFALLLITVSIITYISVISKLNDDNFKAKAADLSETVALVVDKDKFVRVREQVLGIYEGADNKVMSDHWGSDEWNEYTALFSEVENSEDFISLRDSIRQLQDVNPVDCVYLSCVDTVNEKFIYIVDAANEDACPPGCLDGVFDVNKGILDDPSIGFPAYITNTSEYGWLVTAGTPIYSESGEVIGYAMVDISMQEVRDNQAHSVVTLLVYLLLGVLVICIASIVIINKALIKPIKTLTDAAINYTKMDHEVKHDSFVNLEIRTGDEIEVLSDSLKKMESDLNTRIEELSAMNAELAESRHEVNKMERLANRDGLTGVQNKNAYNNYIASLVKELEEDKDIKFGFAMVDLNFLKKINDTYGHEVGDEAIIRLCRIVCKVFEHSPVFRIGGDEFTVVLKNHDYEHIVELIDEFNKKIAAVSEDKSLQPQDVLTASIGYALYDPSIDKSVQDVFKRADDDMYENKREFKNSLYY